MSEWCQESWRVGGHSRPLGFGRLEAGGSCIHSVSAVAEAWVNSTGQTDLNVIRPSLITSVTELGKLLFMECARNICTVFNILNA